MQNDQESQAALGDKNSFLQALAVSLADLVGQRTPATWKLLHLLPLLMS